MISFPAAIKLGFLNYVNFTGYTNRPEFWFWYLFAFLTNLLFSVAGGALFLLLPHLAPMAYTHTADFNALYNFKEGLRIFSAVAGLALFLPTLSAAIRRLRDGGKRWTNIFWLIGSYIISIIIEILGAVIFTVAAVDAYRTHNEGELGIAAIFAIALYVIGALIALVGMIVLIVKLCAPSTVTEENALNAGGYSYYA